MSVSNGSRRLESAVKAVLDAGAARNRLAPASAAYATAANEYNAALERLRATCRACSLTARLPDNLVVRIRAMVESAGPQSCLEVVSAAAVVKELLACASQSAAAEQVPRAQARNAAHLRLPMRPRCMSAGLA